MKHKFFHIPVIDPARSEAELNAFCTQHPIADIEQHFVAFGINSFWSFCVTYVDNQTSFADGIKRKNKIDYKERLSEENFSLYAQLRDLRKTIAEREGTPVYNVFTNEQLANMVEQRLTSKAALLAMEGVGKTRIDKYADIFIQNLKKLLQARTASETDKHLP